MAAGTLQNVVVCVLKSPNSGNSTAPCATVGTDRYVPAVIQEFSVDPSMATILQTIQNTNTPTTDYTAAAAAYAAGLIMVVTCYLMAKAVGTLLALVKRH